MRTAHLIGVFPKLSETFVLNQLTGLIERGVEVDLFGMAQGDLATVHRDVRRYGLLTRDRHLKLPRGRLERALTAARHLMQPYAWRRGTLAALNPLRHGKRALNLEVLYTALSFLKAPPCDLLHCHFGNLGPIGLELRRQRIFKGKLITAFRGADLTSMLRHQPDLYRELLKEGELFLPISDFFRDKLIALGGDPEKIVVLRDGIDLSRFAFRPRCRGAGEPARLLFVGRLEAKKGVLFAAEAVAQALGAGHALEFHVVGDGALRDELEAFVHQRGLAPFVHLHGALPQDQVLTQLERAHLLIAPSVTSPEGDQEGIPNTLKEGMATGLPVLSTLHSGIPELVEDGVSGYLVPENDTAVLTRQLICLLGHPERWAAMGRAGREKVEREYEIEKLNDELVGLYERLLSAPARAAAAATG